MPKRGYTGMVLYKVLEALKGDEKLFKLMTMGMERALKGDVPVAL